MRALATSTLCQGGIDLSLKRNCYALFVCYCYAWRALLRISVLASFSFKWFYPVNCCNMLYNQNCTNFLYQHLIIFWSSLFPHESEVLSLFFWPLQCSQFSVVSAIKSIIPAPKVFQKSLKVNCIALFCCDIYECNGSTTFPLILVHTRTGHWKTNSCKIIYWKTYFSFWQPRLNFLCFHS